MLGSVWLEAALAGLLGLLVGSFLNVVIYRLPKVLERQWLRESAGFLSDESTLAKAAGLPAKEARQASSVNHALATALEQLPTFNLLLPRSRCQKCGHVIRWHENIPVLSYIALKGQCAVCKTAISLRYPTVEILTGAMFALTAMHYSLSVLALAWAVFACILIAQFFIDLDTQILPDDLNYLLLWLGLGAAALGWTTPLLSAIWGVVAGYLCLWLLFHVYRLATGKEGMGYGDFKLLAALGAWFGFEYLIALILLSSLVGSVIGLSMLLFGRLVNKDMPIPFGPFLAGAGLLCLALGPGQLPALLPFAFPFSQ
jgi:leader peptidase (prepilin peptidase) / N-methyltransferase